MIYTLMYDLWNKKTKTDDNVQTKRKADHVIYDTHNHNEYV